MFTSLHQDRLNAKQNAVYRTCGHEIDKVARFQEAKEIFALMQPDHVAFKRLSGYRCPVVMREEPGFLSIKFSGYCINENDAYMHFYARFEVYMVDKKVEEEFKQLLCQF
jgi:hypothetical protein